MNPHFVALMWTLSISMAAAIALHAPAAIITVGALAVVAYLIGMLT